MSTREITREQLENSKIFVKEGSGITFKHPMEYLEPLFKGATKATGHALYAEVGAENMEKDQDSLNTSYSRILAEASFGETLNISLGENDFLKLRPTVGAVVAFDISKPVLKVYAGNIVKACTNLTIFNAEDVVEVDLTSNIKLCADKIIEFNEKMELRQAKLKEEVEKLNSEILSGSKLKEKIGDIVTKAVKNAKLGQTPIMQGIKELYNPKSIYAVKKGETTAWNMYNAFTEGIKKSSILDRSTKTAILSDIFLN